MALVFLVVLVCFLRAMWPPPSQRKHPILFPLPIGNPTIHRLSAAATPRRTGSWRSWLPPPLLERLVRVTTGFLLLLPQLEELALLPAAFVFRRPFAHHVLVLARLNFFTDESATENRIMALAACLPV